MNILEGLRYGSIEAVEYDVTNTDTVAVTATFENLYRRMHGMSLQGMDWVVDVTHSLCQKHEYAGFEGGAKVGVELFRPHR